MGEKFTKQKVVDLISQGYQVITNGIPIKLDIDLWEYLASLGTDDHVLILEDLLIWNDRQLSLIGIAA